MSQKPSSFVSFSKTNMKSLFRAFLLPLLGNAFSHRPGGRKTMSKLCLSCLLWLAAVGLGSSRAADGITTPGEIKAYLQSYCVACHGPDKQKGKLRLDDLSLDFTTRAAATWIEVMDNLNLGEMPPKDAKKQPPAGESVRIARWVASKLSEAAALSHSTRGRVVMRRLNRVEYSNTIRDLLGVTFLEGDGPMKDLPSDGKVAGFDKVGKALLIDASLMASYFRVARTIAEEAIMTEPPKFETKTYTIEPEASVTRGSFTARGAERGVFYYHSPDIHFAPHLGRYPGSNVRVPVKGTYRFRYKLAGIPGEDGVPVQIQINEKFAGNLLTKQGGGTVEKPEVHEVSVVLDPEMNREMPSLKFLNPVSYGGNVTYKYHVFLGLFEKGGHDPATLMRLMARERVEAPNRFGMSTKMLDHQKHRTLYVDSVEIEGPLYPNWPSKAMARLFPEGMADGSDVTASLAQARAMFQKLLPRAFRRPVEPGELDFILNIVKGELELASPYAEAIRVGLVAMLCSPEFLLLAEEPPAVAAKEGKFEIGPFNLAARLSFFLWSSMPDEKLSALAQSGAISDPAVIREQVERMLLDPKADAFVHNFAAQWFKTDEFARFAPDDRLYRKVYAPQFKGLDEDLKREPLEVFRELLRTGGSLLDIIDADWTMLNERLAELYGIPGVKGAAFRRVALPFGSHRGGLLGMAGVHRWGSDGVRTKPVERGKYLLDVLFNSPPPPPPPNAGEVEPNIGGKNLTVRQRLERHKKIESCADCHRGIDPYGLAMENFNVIGEWRDRQDGEDTNWGGAAPPIDTSGILPNGRSYANFAEFKAALLEQNERYLRGLTEKMLIYALGRTLEASDRPSVDMIVQQLKQNKAALRTLIVGIATSQPFRTK